MSWVQQLGATVIRAHYPVGPEIEEMADRDGILIWSEVPVYQVQSPISANRAGWRRPTRCSRTTSSPTRTTRRSCCGRSATSSLAGDGGRGAYIAGATALAKKLDPTRPVGMAVSNWPGLGCQSA